MKKLLTLILVGLIFTALSGCVEDRDMATHISTLEQLQAMKDDLATDYILDNDIDASATSGWNEGLGFDPIDNFSGSFDGQNHKITNLYINRPTENYGGLFGYTNSAAFIKNVGLENCNITGKGYVGGLIGMCDAPVSGSYTTGQVTGTDDYVGGLVGMYTGDYENRPLSNCYSEATVVGVNRVGGLVGLCDDGVETSNCHATGDVTGSADWVGGLIGNNADLSHLTDCYATGSVTCNGDYYAGGLIGYNHRSNLTRCYATGDVTGKNCVGGLCGVSGIGVLPPGPADISQCYAKGTVIASGNYVGGFLGDGDSKISNCYTQSPVSGLDYVGGFVGNYGAETISNSYSCGAVTGTGGNVGGFCASKGDGTISDSFWDTETSGQATSDGGTGKTTTEMNAKSTFTDAGWDFDDIWGICDPPTPPYPWLQWQGSPCQQAVFGGYIG